MIDMNDENEITHDGDEADFNLSKIFGKRAEAQPPAENIQAKKDKAALKASKPKPEPEIDEDADEDEDDDIPDRKKAEDTRKAEDKPKKETAEYYKTELEKLQKSQKDTQKAFHENRKQLAAYRKAVEALKSEGTLMDEEATRLLDHTKFDDAGGDKPVLVRYGDIWDRELQYMRRYSSNPEEIEQHSLAFQHLMQSTSHEEATKILEELSDYEDNEVELTKRMLEIGRQYNEDIYGDIHEVGSIRKLKEKYSQKEKELQERLDKIERKYNKLKEKMEDYDSEPSNYGLPSGSIKGDLPKKGFDIGSVFNSRYQRR